MKRTIKRTIKLCLRFHPLCLFEKGLDRWSNPAPGSSLNSLGVMLEERMLLCTWRKYVLDFIGFETRVISCQRKGRSSPTIWSFPSKFTWRSLRTGWVWTGRIRVHAFHFQFHLEDFLLIQTRISVLSLPDFLFAQTWICVQLSMQLFTSLQHRRHPPYWTFHP